MNEIIQAVRESPLSNEVIDEIIKELENNADNINKLLDGMRFKPPSADSPRMVAEEVFELLIPLFEQYEVPVPNARDTWRHIYHDLGGQEPVTYETEQSSPFKTTKRFGWRVYKSEG